MSSSKFVHLHLHSDGSFLDSGITTKKLCKKITELGDMSAVAITDHGSVSNLLKFNSNAKESGIKPIFGMEGYLHFDISKLDIEAMRSHITMIAMNKEGWQNILKLHTFSYKDGFKRKPQFDYNLLEKHSKGLIILSGCMASHVNKYIRADNIKAAKDIVKRMKSIFGDRYYIEIQRIGLDENDKYLDQLISIAQSTDTKLVATNDVHFLNKEDHSIHDMLCCVSFGKYFGDPSKLTYPKELYLKSGTEMQKLFSDIPEAIESTLEIAERCNLDIHEKRNLYPTYPIPPEFKMDTLEDSQNNYLYNIVRQKYREKLPKELIKDLRYINRVKQELNTIFSMGYSSYFIIVYDFIDFCLKNNIPTGPGRGSAGGSLVCYLLGITLFDPIKADLIFERFLNEGRRGSPPDIDSDISTERREEVISYVFDKYGRDRCCMIGTFGTCKIKTLVRDGCRVLNLPISLADEISKSVPEYSTVKVDFELAVKDSPKFAKFAEDSKHDQKMSLLFRFIKDFEGIKHHSGVHAAGVVIGPESSQLDDYIPLFYDPDKNRHTSAVDMGDVEETGLLKMDFLGLDTLDRIKETVELTKDFNSYFDFINFLLKNNLEDEHTINKVFKNQNTLGVFQFEFEGMQGYMKQLGITEFEDLVIITSAARPGAKDFIPYMSECKYGIRKPEYDDDRLEPILSRTYGVILYQEQAIALFKEMAGFTLVEADLARRAIGKKKADLMDKLKGDFVSGSVKNGFTSGAASSVFDKIALHAGYSFNRSHAYAYSIVSWATAYLKAHYPVEFMSVILTYGSDDMTKKYIEECISMGITILPPCVNKSSCRFTVGRFDSKSLKSYSYYDELYGKIDCKDGDKYIRFGTGRIKGVTENYDFSFNGPYSSIEDFIRKNPNINSKIFTQLVYAGALDCFGIKRSVIFENIDSLLKSVKKIKKHEYQVDLFDDEDDMSGGMKQPEKEWSLKELYTKEMQVINHCFIANFKTVFQDEINEYASGFTIKDFLSKAPGTHCIFIGLVYTKKYHKSKKNGEGMFFLNIGDFESNAEVAVFADAVKKSAERMKDEVSEDLIKDGECLCVNAQYQGNGKFAANYLKRVSLG